MAFSSSWKYKYEVSVSKIANRERSRALSLLLSPPLPHPRVVCNTCARKTRFGCSCSTPLPMFISLPWACWYFSCECGMAYAWQNSERKKHTKMQKRKELIYVLRVFWKRTMIEWPLILISVLNFLCTLRRHVQCNRSPFTKPGSFPGQYICRLCSHRHLSSRMHLMVAMVASENSIRLIACEAKKCEILPALLGSTFFSLEAFQNRYFEHASHSRCNTKWSEHIHRNQASRRHRWVHVSMYGRVCVIKLTFIRMMPARKFSSLISYMLLQFVHLECIPFIFHCL